MDYIIHGLSKETCEEYENILHCLSVLYGTLEGTIPGDRDFGLSVNGLDDISEDMESIYTLEIMEKTDRYEPRVSVSEVAYEHREDGSCKVLVTVEKRDEEWQTS